jgi:hypothetical protein
MSRQSYSVSFFLFIYGLVFISAAAAVTATIFIASNVGILIAILLWLMYFVNRRFQRTTKRSVGWLSFVAPALVYWVLPLWLAYVLIGSWLCFATITTVLARRKLYWSWLLSPKNQYDSIVLLEWLDTTSPTEWAKMLALWAKNPNWAHNIHSFILDLINEYASTQNAEQIVRLEPLKPLMYQYWSKAHFMATENEISDYLAFNMVRRPYFLDILLTRAKSTPSFVSELAFICSQANIHIDHYIENPEYYPEHIAYFLQPDLLDKVERWQEVEILKLADMPNVQEKLQYFFGLHYMAIGIARNMPTAESEASEDETSESETSA